MLARQVESPLVLMLIAAAFVSWLVHARSDAVIILAIVVASAAVGLSQERSAASVVRALLRLVAVRAAVLRDGRDLDVPVEEIVPGDVVRLSAGSIVPGDLRLLQAKNLYAACRDHDPVVLDRRVATIEGLVDSLSGILQRLR